MITARGDHEIRSMKTPIYGSPRSTTQFSLPPDYAVNGGIAVFAFHALHVVYLLGYPPYLHQFSTRKDHSNVNQPE